jgi:hypothetical protein
MLEFGHPQIRNGDKVGCGSETPRSSFCLMEQTIHGLHVFLFGGFMRSIKCRYPATVFREIESIFKNKDVSFFQ